MLIQLPIAYFSRFKFLYILAGRRRGRTVVCWPNYRCLKYICDQPSVRVGAFRSVGLHTRQPSRAAQAIASGAEAESQEGFFVPQELLTKTRRSPIPELKIRTVCTIALIFDRQDTHLHFITAPWLVAIVD